MPVVPENDKRGVLQRSQYTLLTKIWKYAIYMCTLVPSKLSPHIKEKGGKIMSMLLERGTKPSGLPVKTFGGGIVNCTPT